MKILITGGTGFIGRHLLHRWQDKPWQLAAITSGNTDTSFIGDHVHCFCANITDSNAVQSVVLSFMPDIVIHLAAWSKPNECELQKDKCYAVNVQGTQHIVNACISVGARLIFMSTDFVFGHHGPYVETDACCPVNYYGESKVMAEKIITASTLSYAIVRTVMVYGKKLSGQKNTFLHWVKENLEQGNAVKVFTDQYRSCTYVDDLCWGIESIIDTRFEGIIHFCGQEVFTPFEIAQKVAAYCNCNSTMIHPVTRMLFPEAAVRPENSVLQINKAKNVLGYTTTPLASALSCIF